MNKEIRLKRNEYIEITQPFSIYRSFLPIEDIKHIEKLDNGRKYFMAKSFSKMGHRFFPTNPEDIIFVEKVLKKREENND